MAAAGGGGGSAPGALLRGLERLSAWVNGVLVGAAALMLAAMMLLAVFDMVARGFGFTIAGSYEVIGWMSAAAIALALGAVQREHGHVAMDLFVARLGARSRTWVEAAMTALALALFVALAFYVLRYAVTLHATGSKSETLQVIVYPWVYVVGAGCAGLALALLVDLLRALQALAARPAAAGS